MSIQEIRDNLNIGVTLADKYPFGLVLDDLLVECLGYTPGGPSPVGDREHYISRLHRAQRIGERNYLTRQPGYFTINAQPFGNIFVYKSVWYTWLNPKTAKVSTVLICSTDILPMRQWRDRYLATRTYTTRAIRAADNLVRQDNALIKGDIREIEMTLPRY
jgi:hypothetical protein